MNTMFKVATLSALMACGAAFAQDPGPPVPPEQADPPARPSDPIPAPSDETMPENTTSPETQTSMPGDSKWQDFRTADTNGDGYVSKNEAEANPMLIEIFTEVDEDQSGSLSSGEYDAARRAHEGRDTGEQERDRY